MKKSRYIFIVLASIIFILFLTYLVAITLNSTQYPEISDNAKSVMYHDITEKNPGNRIKSGVEITYIEGHIESDSHVLFNDYRPYKRLELYEDEGVFIIIYDEDNNGEKKDRFLSLKGWPGYHLNNDSKVEVYRNGKRVKNVKVYFAEE